MSTSLIKEQPFYQPTSDEVELFTAAYNFKMPLMLKGPTGCGKTRFIEYMAWKLERPLITVSCNEDMTAADLIGRFLLIDGETRWQDGPLTQAVRSGAICYLDEIVEARQDTTVAIHSLTDHRRQLALDKTGELLTADERFFLVISYNPGYQSLMKDLKTSTKQRFVSLNFSPPDAEKEQQIVVQETGIDDHLASRLVQLGQSTRRLKGQGLEEGVSTRLLIYAAQLILKGIDPYSACRMALLLPLSDDPEVQDSLDSLLHSYFPATN